MSNQEISPQQAKAIAALLSGHVQAKAAEAAGVTHRTLTRWLNDETFTAELNRQKSLAIAQATARLVGSMEMAITIIQAVMVGKVDHDATPRLRAAKIALDAALRLVEINDLVKRIEELEGRL